MEAMGQGDMTRALQALRTCDQILQQADKYNIQEKDRAKITALTMNNLGCYYKKLNLPLVALRYMELSLKADVGNGAPLSHIASTKLNICAVLSSIKRHVDAKQLAQEAVKDLLKAIDNNEKQDGSSIQYTLMIAQFNLAVEFEHLNELQDALDSYQQALIYANQCNDENIAIFAGEAIDKVKERLTE